MEAVLGESMNNRKARVSKQPAVAAALVSMGDYAQYAWVINCVLTQYH